MVDPAQEMGGMGLKSEGSVTSAKGVRRALSQAVEEQVLKPRGGMGQPAERG